MSGNKQKRCTDEFKREGHVWARLLAKSFILVIERMQARTVDTLIKRQRCFVPSIFQSQKITS